MNVSLRLALLPLLLAACAAPQIPPPRVLAPDDDHRWVNREEFQQSPWASLPAAVSWKAEGLGVGILLADGRTLRLEWVEPAVLRWWIPAAPQEISFSPGARYSPPATLLLKIREEDGVVIADTPNLGFRLRLSDLSWKLVRGDQTVVSVDPPQAAGRRLRQSFSAPGRWFATSGAVSSQYWADQSNADQTGPFAAPGLLNAGRPTLGIVLDNTYQTYSRIEAEQAVLGSLNGGLDLLLSASNQPAAVTESLTEVLGRPASVPQWALSTALALPDTETGDFVRKAKLSIETAVGKPLPRLRFHTLYEVPGAPLPDLTAEATLKTWTAKAAAEVTQGSGIALAVAPGRRDWNARFADRGADSPLARMNNRLAGAEAQGFQSLWSQTHPNVRPLILAGSGSWGTIRSALPSVDAGTPLPALLSSGALGLGTPAVRLDLRGLGAAETRAEAYQQLLGWLLAPVLILDWGPDPAALWTALPDADKKRLKAILDRRSGLKPHLVQLMHEAAFTGRPVLRPLWFAFSDPRALTVDDEYLVGDSLLVAPTSPRGRSVYLPGPGVWFDFWTGQEYGGGRRYDLEASVDKPLLFARGGALIPTRDPEVYDNEFFENPLTMQVFPGDRGQGQYFLDDGRTVEGGFWETRVLFDLAPRKMTLVQTSVRTTGSLKPEPYILYRVHQSYRPTQVRVEGKAVPLFGDSFGVTDSDRSAAWYEHDQTLLIKVFRPDKDQTIEMLFN